MIEVIVEDTGIGIKQEDQSELFKLFGFINATSELNSKGVGLGLYISSLIIRHLGGECHVDSQWGVGSKFIFLIALGEKTENMLKLQRC